MMVILCFNQMLMSTLKPLALDQNGKLGHNNSLFQVLN